MAVWDKISSRGNVEDRRGMGPVLIGGGGLGATGIILYLLVTFLGGGDLGDVLNQLPATHVINQPAENSAEFEGADSYEVFASTVLGSNNDTWSQLFAQNNVTYEPPKLVLFRGATQSACGGADVRYGPHYCPLDETIYLDETFFDELQTRFGAQGGDVAEAYVISHEVAHHVQNKLGIMEEIQQVSRNDQNGASINLELQADCFAGLWAHSIKNLGVFEQGEIIEAIDAAAAVGDDRIQASVTGRVNPETWTHGSSEQRVSWFNRGYESGSVDQCNTFE
jgi:uncharacterized protein